ncbi:MAG: 23S rRNA (uracil(1939)-C(5))-methyltransferase RlmD [Clostridia bacterium]|nr:23S rRNA (uracil(1939)-C(5))-methyltransferase RlmD [Clostridia bacterium]
MKKNDIYILEAIDNGVNFEGICKVDNFTIFVPGLIKGEIAKVKILKVNSSFAFGKIEEFIQKSEFREETQCGSYKKCGGCEALHVEYTKTLDMKREMAINTIKKQGIAFDFSNSLIYGMGNPLHYRNKVQYPVRNINGEISIGMFSKRSHNLVEINDCKIQDEIINEVAFFVFEQLKKYNFKGYDETNNTGDIKNIMVRRGIHTDEIMCVLVVTKKEIVNNKNWEIIVKNLVNEFANIKSVILNINENNTNVILSNENICIYGINYIMDYIGDYVFKIGANSFFQVNTIQAETLYNVLKEKLELSQEDKLLDLYSGVGSIGIFLSDAVKEVFGIEIVQDAVNMAQDNIQMNNIENVKCIQGDATEEIQKLEQTGTKFDIVVVDPPRKGLDKEGIEILKKIQSKQIGYVSCNVATLARDLKLLEEKYEICSIDFVDMFPFTGHVECVAVMCLK